MIAAPRLDGPLRRSRPATRSASTRSAGSRPSRRPAAPNGSLPTASSTPMAYGAARQCALLLHALRSECARPRPIPVPPSRSSISRPASATLLARTSWDEDAAWFTYSLGWVGIDHQNGDGNCFSFYRDGEWLTKGTRRLRRRVRRRRPQRRLLLPELRPPKHARLENDRAVLRNVPDRLPQPALCARFAMGVRPRR